MVLTTASPQAKGEEEPMAENTVIIADKQTLDTVDQKVDALLSSDISNLENYIEADETVAIKGNNIIITFINEEIEYTNFTIIGSFKVPYTGRYDLYFNSYGTQLLSATAGDLSAIYFGNTGYAIDNYPSTLDDCSYYTEYTLDESSSSFSQSWTINATKGQTIYIITAPESEDISWSITSCYLQYSIEEYKPSITPIKSIQSGTTYFSSTTRNITLDTEVNPDKCIILLDGTGNSNLYAPYLSALTSTTLTLACASSGNSSFKISYQVIEFY